jgi:hypothetical protein
MATVPDSQPLRYEEVQESEEDVSRHLLADISIIYGATLPAELASKQHPIPTPPQGSSHPFLETSQQMQHHPDHDYGSLKEYNSYLDDGPSRNKIPIHREDLQISRPPLARRHQEFVKVGRMKTGPLLLGNYHRLIRAIQSFRPNHRTMNASDHLIPAQVHFIIPHSSDT